MSQPKPDRVPGEIASVTDYIPYACERVTEAAWAYLNAGAGDGFTAADNISAFQRLKLLPNAMCATERASTQVTLLGQTFLHPIMLAPVAYQKLAHPDGEIASALGASAMGAAMVVSTQASYTLEQISLRSKTPLWFQLYLQPALENTLQLVRRAEAAGYQALVVTVDAPINGLRNEEQRSGFRLPDDIQAVNLPVTPAASTAQATLHQRLSGPLLTSVPTWESLAQLTAQTRLPVLATGITHPADAERALRAGCAGIIVSNHGGRVLDGVPAAIDLLPSVASAVGKDVPVLLDGGIRRGTDIVKALALGARAVLIGRAQVYGLATAGAAGVAHVLHILRTELEMAMLLTGRVRIEEIDSSLLWNANG